MSQMEPADLQCPECGHTQEVVVWSSLNVSLDPELRQRLFDGEINVFRCAACDHEALIAGPLLYHDMEREYCVQYYPERYLEDEGFLQQFTRVGRRRLSALEARLVPSSAYLAAPHIVFDLTELLRYVEFRDRLFDAHMTGDKKDS